MCGICGVFGERDEPLVRAMLATIRHRGPDDTHLLSGARATLGAVRLSIVDLDGGRQPMTSEDGHVIAAQNGEIYNAPGLHRQLRAGGHSLASHCDTECLPHLYEEHGERFVERIDGMFAASVWDERARRGILVRDRMGKKPLYYALRAGKLYYASELKALLQVPVIDADLNPVALHHYLGFKHVPHPLTIFQDVFILPPAHYLVWEAGKPLRIERYWDVNFVEDPDTAKMSEEEIVDRLVELLRRGVEKRLMADVPIGFFLSGGVDSSLSTVLAAEMSSGPIKTFTLSYAGDSTTPGKEQDSYWARWVAKKYGTEHHEETLTFGDFPEQFRRILRSFDEPFAGVVSTYFLSELISRHVKVAISGDGADELFGSYLSHRLAVPLANYPEYCRTGDAGLIRLFEDQPEFLKRLHDRSDWQWRAKLLVFDDGEKQSLYSRDYAADYAATLGSASSAANLRETYQALRAKHPLNRVLNAEFRTFFPDQVLTFTDRLSMAHSLEVRTAFLDTDFVTFAAGLPADLRIRGGETKYALKQAARRFLPEEMVFRPKEGFVMPVNAWLLNNLRPYVRETLSPGRLAEHGIFAPEAVGRLVDSFYAGENRHANKILSLVAFQEWFSLYKPSVRPLSAAA